MYKILTVIDFLFAFIGGSVLTYFFQFNLMGAVALLLIFKRIMNRMHNPLYAHRDLLKKPGTGLHAITFYGIPIVDFIITFIGACGASYLLQLNVFLTFVASWLLGQYLHYIFGVNTRFFKNMGLLFEKNEDS